MTSHSGSSLPRIEEVRRLKQEGTRMEKLRDIANQAIAEVVEIRQENV